MVNLPGEVGLRCMIEEVDAVGGPSGFRALALVTPMEELKL